MISESHKNRLHELAGIKTPGELNDSFKLWFRDSKVSVNGEPVTVYHGTGAKFKKFNMNKANQKLIWFTTNKSEVEAGNVGARGKGHIMDLFISIQNPAGWDEYKKYLLFQLKDHGYDGAILPDTDGGFTGFVFHPNQIKSVMNDGSWNTDDNNIYS